MGQYYHPTSKRGADMKEKALSVYGGMIKHATTKEELSRISYDALINDHKCTVFSKKYNAIIEMCVKRKMELGL